MAKEIFVINAKVIQPIFPGRGFIKTMLWTGAMAGKPYLTIAAESWEPAFLVLSK